MNTPNKKICLLVLGMHRSGTSALTGALHAMGVDLGSDLMDARSDNPKGFFENNSITLFNERLMGAIGSTWDDPDPLPPDWLLAPVLKHFEPEARAILEREFPVDAPPLLAIKDPRLSILLPWWLPIFRDLGWNPRAVILSRNPFEVAASHAKRDGFPTEKTLLVWLKHQLSAEIHSRGLRRAFVDFDQFLSHPEAQLDLLFRRLEMGELSASPEQTAKVKAFLDPGLRHHRESHDSSVDPTYALAMTVHQRFTEIAAGKLSEEAIRETQFGADLLNSWQALRCSYRPGNERVFEGEHATLFLDAGKGFNEEESISLPLGICSRQTFEFEIEKFYSLHELRLDPCEAICAIRISKLQFVNDYESFEPSMAIDSSHCLREGGLFFFFHEDPYLVIPAPTKPARALVVTIDYITIGEPGVTWWLSQFAKKNPALRRETAPADNRRREPSEILFQNDREAFEARDGAIRTLRMAHPRDASDSAEKLPGRDWLRPLWETISGGLRSLREALTGSTTRDFFDPAHYARQCRPLLRGGRFLHGHYLTAGWCRSLDPHPLFSVRYYRARPEAETPQAAEPLRHYLTQGWKEGRNPHPLFDTAYYLEMYPDVADNNAHPFVHFCKQGWKEGRNPHPLFDTRYYLEAHPDIAVSNQNPLIHYCQYGWKEGRKPHPLFDTSAYLKHLPWFKSHGIQPLIHYCLGDWWEAPNMHPLFDAAFYLRKYPDIREGKINPLWHYCRYGWKEGRNPHPLFDTRFYLDQCPDVAAARLNPLVHYVQRGWKEERRPNRWFDAAYYRSVSKQATGSETNPLVHYLETGWKQGNSPSAAFNARAYLLHNPDVAALGEEPLSHFIEFGRDAYRIPFPVEATGDPAGVEARLNQVPVYTDPHRDPPPRPEGRTAVHLHLEEAADIPPMRELLSKLPMDYDLFLSLDSGIAPGDPALQSLSQLEGPSKTATTIIAPGTHPLVSLLENFSAPAHSYRYLLHGSLSRGAGEDLPGTSGRRVLETLCASSPEVSQILQLLAEDGLTVTADNHRELPPSESPWNRLHPSAAAILACKTEARIEDFPQAIVAAGGCFWARVEAIKAWLDLPVTGLRKVLLPDQDPGALLQHLVPVLASLRHGRNYRIPIPETTCGSVYYEEQADLRPHLKDNDVRVLAFFLPQFYPIPENDAWHGKGFTEWHKVRGARPLFQGHYQQHVPHPDIGYYQLEGTEHLRKLPDMMKKAGVHGMVFYHYWFTGKMVLERPARTLLEHLEIDLPFCYCWANEDWTRRWDGEEKDVLLKQNYSVEDAGAFIRHLIPFFKDSRYIRVNNRPLLLVYRPTAQEDWSAYLETWEAACASAGLPKPYVVATLTRGATDPRDFGMDAAVERPLHDWTDGAVRDIRDELNPYGPLEGSFLDYREVANHYTQKTHGDDFQWFRCLLATWDNTPRYGTKAIGMHRFHPPSFQEWSATLVRQAREHLPAGERFVFVNAWNEWAEGAHLEPDRHFGYAHLNAIGRSLAGIPFDSTSHIELTKPALIQLRFPEPARERLERDPEARRALQQCLRAAAEHCGTRFIDPPPAPLDPGTLPVGRNAGNQTLTLTIEDPVVFPPEFLAELLRMEERHRGFAIAGAVLNDPDILTDLPETNQSIAPGTPAPIRLQRGPSPRGTKLCSTASCFRLPTHRLEKAHRLPVSTVVRHHSAKSLNRLLEALLSLICQRDCVVKVVLMIQDADESRLETIRRAVQALPWPDGGNPILLNHHSTPEHPDLRSQLLMEGLRRIATGPAAILDDDDVLFPGAYHHLASRLLATGANATFARVYCTRVREANIGRMHRHKAYVDRSTYPHYLEDNFIPLHSMMLNLNRIALEGFDMPKHMPYMEDYLLTLQIFNAEETDWKSLEAPVFIGDYIHWIGDNTNTLALLLDEQIDEILKDPLYLECQYRIDALRMKHPKAKRLKNPVP